MTRDDASASAPSDAVTLDAAQPTRRFSNRVLDYARARPTYPERIIDLIGDAVGPTARVADIGSGTGIFTRLLLSAGHIVYAVEPNDAMRNAAEQTLADLPGFHSVRGTAEATTLPARHVDLVVAAQAFHWFDRDAFRRECERILRPSGQVALIWNDRLTQGTPFLEAYETLLQQFAVDYVAVNHRNISESAIAAFYSPGEMRKHVRSNVQVFDFDRLRARLLSSSYAPPADDPRSKPMLARLRQIFDDNAAAGCVEMRYETQLFLGRLTA